MAEQVVYEDTPFAEYLQSIESTEVFEKQLDPQDISSPTESQILQNFSMLQDKFFTMFRSFVSTSLPAREEAAFEEEFKYMIATSSLLNDTVSIQRNFQVTYNKSRKPMSIPLPNSNSTTPSELMSNPKAVFFGVSIGVSSVAMAALFRRQASSSRRWPYIIPALLTASSLTAISIFLLYRHLRLAYLRTMRENTLIALRNLITASYTLDIRVQKTLHFVQEIELVSRGYRLSMPLSPISRIEQTNKNRRCLRTRLALIDVFSRTFGVFEQIMAGLEPYLNRDNLSAFYEMYGVVPVASLEVDAPESDSTSLDALKKTFLLVHLKRRECLLTFLALDVLSHEVRERRRSPRARDTWNNVGKSLSELTEKMDELIGKVENILESELYPTPQPVEPLPAVASTAPRTLQPFLHHIASLESQLRALHAKLYICSEDANNSSNLEESLQAHYSSIRPALETLLADYELGRMALTQHLEPEQIKVTDGYPSPPVSPPPLESPSPSRPMSMIIEDNPLALESEGGMWEGIAGELNNNGGSKMERRFSRRERIEEMKRKREEEVEKKAAKLETERMVTELKDVLTKRGGLGITNMSRAAPTREQSEDMGRTDLDHEE